MKKALYSSIYLLLSGLLFLTSCHNTRVTSREDQPLSTDNEQSRKLPVDSNLTGQTMNQGDYKSYWKNKNCPRGTPEQTLNSQNPNLLKINFELNQDGATEKAQLFSGDSLYISNTGCDYYALTYTLRSFTPQAAQGDSKYWFRRASDLFLALQDSKVPFDCTEVSGLLQQKLNSADTEIGKEMPLSSVGKGKGYLEIEETGKLLNGRGGYVKIKLFAGPL